MERTGLGRRLPAALLDWIFVSFITAVVVVIYSVAGGTRLAAQVQQHLGVPITLSSVTSERVWTEFEREAEQMVSDFAAQVQDEFTDEQAEFIARTMAETMERYVEPERVNLEYILQFDARILEGMVDDAFDAVIAADRPDLPPAKVNELRAETKQLMDRFALGQIVPAAVRFAVWLALIPVLTALAYGFTEAVWGRTLGKLVLGIVVEREDEGPPVPGRMLRYALKYAPMLLVVLTVATRIPFFAFFSGGAAAVILVGSLAMLTPERRALHDYVAGTVVTRAAPRR